MCMHNSTVIDYCIRVITSEALSDAELARLHAAIVSRRAATRRSYVIERRPYRDGVLQLEARRNPKTGAEKRYWYFKHRKDGKQRTVYVGKTDEPESVADHKLKGES
jgi:hypothetical protein